MEEGASRYSIARTFGKSAMSFFNLWFALRSCQAFSLFRLSNSRDSHVHRPPRRLLNDGWPYNLSCRLSSAFSLNGHVRHKAQACLDKSDISMSESFSGADIFLEVLHTTTRIGVSISRTSSVGNPSWCWHAKLAICFTERRMCHFKTRYRQQRPLQINPSSEECQKPA